MQDSPLRTRARKETRKQNKRTIQRNARITAMYSGRTILQKSSNSQPAELRAERRNADLWEYIIIITITITITIIIITTITIMIMITIIITISIIIISITIITIIIIREVVHA